VKPRATVAFLGLAVVLVACDQAGGDVYPSAILRVPDEAAKRELYGMLVSDLGLAGAAALITDTGGGR
jgi:hypothetical protein